jgi:saccharopine dehydrogenase (NADP+, L-glutamate forming)
MFEIKHEFGLKETGTSTLVEYGDPKVYSAMAKLIGVPCGVANKQMLDGIIRWKVMLAPMTIKINGPSIEELKKSGIFLIEKAIA